MQKSINKLRILTPEKFQAEYPHIFKRNFGEIALNRVHFCKAECLRQAVTGTFAIPRKTKLTGDKITFGYCIAEEQLIFIENQDHIKIEMKKVREYQDEERTSPLLLLFDWMEYLIKDDMLFLQDYEEKLSHLEEELLEGNMEDFDRKILLSRKELSVLSAYYEQLSDMGETLQQNAARHQTEQEALLFGLFCEKAGRLYDVVQTLKEYSMQLREMHQTQIDIRQNEIMKVLTIVTTLFMPLTLIAGWYGMNFAHMPELTAPGGYGIICVVCLLLIAVEIWIFKKKGWFK